MMMRQNAQIAAVLTRELPQQPAAAPAKQSATPAALIRPSATKTAPATKTATNNKQRIEKLRGRSRV
jgi:hypothetical protein